MVNAVQADFPGSSFSVTVLLNTSYNIATYNVATKKSE